MSTTENTRRTPGATSTASGPSPMRTETKASTRTTELFVYLAATLAVVVASVVVGDKGPQTPDPFNAVQALQYITFLTTGYMIRRGLARAGSCHHSHD